MKKIFLVVIILLLTACAELGFSSPAQKKALIFDSPNISSLTLEAIYEGYYSHGLTSIQKKAFQKEHHGSIVRWQGRVTDVRKPMRYLQVSINTHKKIRVNLYEVDPSWSHLNIGDDIEFLGKIAFWGGGVYRYGYTSAPSIMLKPAKILGRTKLF